MGFLLGAYGKIMAGKRVRDLQYKQTQLTMRLQRVSKNVAEMEKRFTAQEKQINIGIQQQYMYAMMPYNNIISQYTQIGDPNSPDYQDRITTAQQNMQEYSRLQMAWQFQMSLAKQAWSYMFEMQRDSQLVPLKEEEDAIQTELESVKSQLKIAEQEYKAKEEEEKAGVQMLKPDYTGQS